METLVLCFLLSLLVLCSLVAGAPLGLTSTTTKESDFHVDYLRHFGYIDENSVIEVDEEVVRTAVENFQKMVNLPVTGIIDAATDKMMRAPRCGLPDLEPHSSREKRYALFDTRWGKKNLTYSLQSYPDQNLTHEETKSIIREAFQKWTDVSALRITELGEHDGADITLNFFRGAHGDSTAFDGRGRVLAHTYTPREGKVHFDNDEVWTPGTSTNGTNLLYIATHELGHAVGLQHSSEPDSVMRPYFHGQLNTVLGNDDIAGVQALYGPSPANNNLTTSDEPITTTTTITPEMTITMQRVPIATENNASTGGTPKSSESKSENETESETATTTTTAERKRPPTKLFKTKEDWCSDGQIDAVLRIGLNPAYAFRGNVYAELKEGGIDADGVRSIADDWPGLENNIDATFHWAPDNTQPIAYSYFFKGELCWKYNLSRELAPGFPRPIREEFHGIPDDLDAVLVISSRSFTYFIKESRFYRYSRPERRVYPGYPLSLHTWKDLPSRVDAAVKWLNARPYFFRAGKTYLVNSRRVESGYPKSTAKTWLGCSKEKVR